MVVTKLTLIGSLIAKLTIANLDHFATAGWIEQITWSMRNNIFIMMLRQKYIDIYICLEKYIYCYNRLQPNTKRNYDRYFQLG